MGLSFLAPFFLAGAALIAVPFILHQIRRPEREPLEFSSLMFVPSIKKEVIERRRIQHILLMLLRMLILLLLALAFARPAWESLVSASTEGGRQWHALLIDRSYSMRTNQRQVQALNQAQTILNSLRSKDRAAVIAFDRRPEVLEPLWDAADPEIGRPHRARQAVQSIESSQQVTRYLPALQRAQELFQSLQLDEEDDNEKWVVHVISDFQQIGMPQNRGGWRLPERYELKTVAVGETAVENYALTDMAIRPQPQHLQIVAKVFNGTLDQDVPRRVNLMLGGEVVKSSTLRVTPGNSSQISFRLALADVVENAPHRRVEGHLQLEDDALLLDNRRYFVWNPPRQADIRLITQADLTRSRSAAWFLQQALAGTDDAPWAVTAVPPNEAVGGAAVDLNVLSDLENVSPIFFDQFLNAIENGGKALVILDERLAGQPGAQAWLEALGIKVVGPRWPQAQRRRYELMSWVDFEHEVFIPLQSAQYNDFSSILFYNYMQTAMVETKADTPRVLARFESSEPENPSGQGQNDDNPNDGKPNGERDGWPTMIEAQYGDGKVVIWTFAPNLQWTNFVRSTKFIPILYESVEYLIERTELEAERLVGEPIQPPAHLNNEALQAQLPGENAIVSLQQNGTIQGAQYFERAGLMRWHAADQSDESNAQQTVQAVNIDAVESNLERVALDEFRYVFSSAPVIDAAPQQEGEALVANVESEDRRIDEFGRGFLLLMAAFVIFETWYATRFV